MRARLTRNRPVLVGTLSSVVLTLLLAAVLIPGHSARAAANAPAATTLEIFAQIGTIPGDSTNAKFLHQIPVESFSFAAMNQAAGQGTGARSSKAIASPITFTAAAGSDSPFLLKALAQVAHPTPVVFSFVHNAGESQVVFQKYQLDGCTITSFHQTAQQNGVVEDEVQITFTKVTYTFTQQKPDGSPGASVTVTWDIAKGTAS